MLYYGTTFFCKGERMKKRIILPLIALVGILTSACQAPAEQPKISTTTSANAQEPVSTTETSVEQGAATTADLSKGIEIISNKKHSLPADYNPGEHPLAKKNVQALIREMQRLGFAINSQYSGFRSYEYQASLYQTYVNRDGQSLADTYSARPGYSEHQTGLAFDILNAHGELLGEQPGDTEAIAWLHQHAHEYGFVVRYPEGKEAITGYQPEPWHLRFIGDKAPEIYQSGQTLEEFFNVPGGGYAP